jgi:glycosyltransferase involved in cell wall biosynthesis
MNCDRRSSAAPHLVWVCPASPVGSLDAATWLETTRELRKLGWRVTLVMAGPAGDHFVEGVRVRCIPMPRVYLLGQGVFHIQLLGLLAVEWPTIRLILFHQLSAVWLLPLRFIRPLTRRRSPLLVMDTRTVPMEATRTATRKDRLRGSFYQLMNRLANHWADGQTAITAHMAELTCIPPKQLWGIWSSGVHLALFTPALRARRWPAEEEPIHLVYVGVLHYERNLLPLCRAVEKANDEGMAFVLSLIGNGTERADLEKFAVQTQGRVRIVPPVPHDQVPSLLAQAHVGVLPFPDESKFRVSSPIKLFEYMAAGLPVLATRIVCHTDVIGDGQFAFWAEGAGAGDLLATLRLIWDARAHLDEMGREAAAAAHGWTWEVSARRLEASLERGLHSVNRGRGAVSPSIGETWR